MVNKMAAAISTTLGTGFCDIDVRDGQDVAIEVKNAGATAFNAFAVQGMAADSPNPANAGNFVTLLSASGDYTTPKYPLLRATTDPTALVGGASTLLFLKAAGLSKIRLQASVTAGSTTADVHARPT